MEFKKGKFFDNNYKELTAHPEEAAGNMIECEVVKNKICKPTRRMLRYTLHYEKGIDLENDLFTMGVGLGLITRSGAWYGLADDEDVRFQGKNGFIEYLQNNPEQRDKLHEKVMEYVRAD